MNINDPYDLKRFLLAQQYTYEQALFEIKNGRKQSHWIWYIFPQFVGLGYSSNSKLYAIKSIDEAKAYLHHPILGPRLAECAKAALAVNGRTAYAIFGDIDELKVWSCATLFAHIATTESVFEDLLNKYYNGKHDPNTLRVMGITADSE